MERAEPEAVSARERPAGEQGLSDQELVAEVLRKDRKAAAEFVSRCADPVYGYVRRRLIPRGDLVDDVVQEVFLAAWESLPEFRAESSLRAWVLGIARHKVEDHYRKRLKEISAGDADELSFHEEPASSENLEEALAAREIGQRTREVLAQLPEIYGVVLLWRYWEKRSATEIAAQTERTEKAVERLLARAREQFKKKWNERESSKQR